MVIVSRSTESAANNPYPVPSHAAAAGRAAAEPRRNIFMQTEESVSFSAEPFLAEGGDSSHQVQFAREFGRQ